MATKEPTYIPPFVVSPEAINLIAEISGQIERYAIRLEREDSLRLRKANRIKTIHSSLAIEGNTLTEDEVSDILDGKSVVAPIRQIQEVKNAIKTYELYPTLDAFKEKDLLKAHGVMMQALVDDAGRYRRGGVGVFGEEGLVHLAPPADRVPLLMKDLFDWLTFSKDHLLIRSCVFHFEFEFIHPFIDGNGRMGRLWQSLILGKLHPIFEHLPVENMVLPISRNTTMPLPRAHDLVSPDNDPTKARVERTALGNTLVDCLLSIPRHHRHVEILHFCLMPDHLHAVIYVTHEMPKGIRSVVRGFWQASKKLGRASSFSPNGIRDNYQEGIDNLRERLGDAAYYCLPAIFTEMPFVRPMGQRRQLPATIRYIEMNPQRLATKRLMPGYFRVQEGIEIARRTYAGVGNTALLLLEHFAPVHVRHTMVEAAEHGEDQSLRDYMNGCVLAARQGTVMVSPFISPKEKEVLEVLLREGHPFICLADNGFRDYYKPTDALFDACAAGKALILSPWEYDAKKRHVSRADCMALNAMAEEICSSFLSPDAIRDNSKKTIIRPKTIV